MGWQNGTKQENGVKIHDLVKRESFDAVERPPHYADRKYPVWDVMEDSMGDRYVGFLEGNVLKYMMRWDKKGKPVEDLKKAKQYLEKLIKAMEEK